jgi:molybdopterin-synthase adenylyltransferase
MEIAIDSGRFSRQAELVPQDRLRSVGATVIGVGAIGRQVALQLAGIGAQKIQLVDFDTVELSNITTQGYGAADVGQLKVQATAEAIHRIETATDVMPIADRFRSKLQVSEAVFCCVDSIDARAAIWRSVQNRCRFWADGRMRGEVLRVLAAADSDGRRYYSGTLFPESQAQVGSCTSRSTFYTASIAAGLIVHQFTRWLRKLPVDRDWCLNLLAGEWSVL